MRSPGRTAATSCSRRRCRDAVVRADARRLSQAAGNLIANALEHGAGTVGLGARAWGDRVRIEVVRRRPRPAAPRSRCSAARAARAAAGSRSSPRSPGGRAARCIALPARVALAWSSSSRPRRESPPPCVRPRGARARPRRARRVGRRGARSGAGPPARPAGPRRRRARRPARRAGSCARRISRSVTCPRATRPRRRSRIRRRPPGCGPPRAVVHGTDLVPAVLADGDASRRRDAAARGADRGARRGRAAEARAPGRARRHPRHAGWSDAALALEDVEVLAAAAGLRRLPIGCAARSHVSLRVKVRQAVYLAAAQTFAREIRVLPRAAGGSPSWRAGPAGRIRASDSSSLQRRPQAIRPEADMRA